MARAEDRLAALFLAFPVAGTPSEAVTEADLIHPALEALGWEDYLPQQTTSGRGRVDVPDVLLFPDAAAKTTAQAEAQEQDRYRHGMAIVESKRWGRKLDRAEAATTPDAGAPSTQMLRYLSRAETASHDRIRWASSPTAATGGWLYVAGSATPRRLMHARPNAELILARARTTRASAHVRRSSWSSTSRPSWMYRISRPGVVPTASGALDARVTV